MERHAPQLAHQHHKDNQSDGAVVSQHRPSEPRVSPHLQYPAGHSAGAGTSVCNRARIRIRESAPDSKLFQALPSQKHALEAGIEFVSGYMQQASQGLFVGVGIVVLLWTMISLMSNIEDTFNTVWGVTHALVRPQGNRLYRNNVSAADTHDLLKRNIGYGELRPCRQSAAPLHHSGAEGSARCGSVCAYMDVVHRDVSCVSQHQGEV